MRVSLFWALVLFSSSEFALADSCIYLDTQLRLHVHIDLDGQGSDIVSFFSFRNNIVYFPLGLSSHSNSQLSCTATSTITALASPVTKTVTSASTCPSLGATHTITSVSISTTTVTSTVTMLPACFPRIIGGDFTTASQNIGAFTVTQNPAQTIFYQVLVPSAETLVVVSDGTPQFLFLNYALLPNPTTFTLSQYIGTMCAPYTSLNLSATINAGSSDGVVTFCINPTTCSTPQSVAATNGKFVQYSATFLVSSGMAVTASMSLAVNDFVPAYFAGIGNLELVPS